MKLRACTQFGALFSQYRVSTSEDSVCWDILANYQDVNMGYGSSCTFQFPRTISGKYIRIEPVGEPYKGCKWGLSSVEVVTPHPMDEFDPTAMAWSDKASRIMLGWIDIENSAVLSIHQYAAGTYRQIYGCGGRKPKPFPMPTMYQNTSGQGGIVIEEDYITTQGVVDCFRIR